MMNEPNSKFENPKLDNPKLDNPRREDAGEDERWAAAQRRYHFLAALCLVLAAAIVALAWYTYPTLKAQSTSLLSLPSLRQTVDTVGDRLKAAEARAADSLHGQQSLRGQVNDLGRNLRARIEAVSQEGTKSVEDAYHRLETKLDSEMQAQTERLASVNLRVAELEASRESDQVQIAELKQNLSQVREQAEQSASQQSGELEKVRRQVEEGRLGQSQEFAALKRDQDRDRRSLSAVADQIAIRKIPFEATKDHNRDLADGITLHIESTNPTYRRVSGWMWIAGDRRNVWLRNQDALQPLIFYGSQDGQKRELVITNVTNNSVTGYLLLPKDATQPAPAAAGAAGQ